jgi:hypothetical protein
MLALAIVTTATCGGTAATYLYDDSWPLTTRIAAGACLGLAMLGLTGFVAASLLGFGLPALLTSAALAGAPLTVFVRGTARTAARLDLSAALARVRRAVAGRDRAALWSFGLFLLLAAPLVVVLTTVVYQSADGIYTGLFVNRNDLPLHIDIIEGFATGGNFPPQHPEFAGARLTYPFLVDFIAAQLMGAGLTLQGAVALENVVLLLALIVLLHRWALALTGERAAALQTPLLVLLGSGLGWLLIAVDARAASSGWLAFIWNLPYDYTMNTRHLQWGNVTTTMIATQRSFLLGLPLFMIVWTLWWRAVGERDDPARIRSMVAAGVIAGCLPLVHTHSYMVAIGMAGVLSLVFWSWRAWLAFFVVAVALAVPQLLWVSHGSLLNTRGFIGWYPGWTKESENYFWFWFKNTGLFIPLLVAALATRRHGRVVSRTLLLFYLPFLLCFIAPQLFRFAPRITANMKILIYWYIASTPLVALLLARLWQRRGMARYFAVAAMLTLTAAASLDVWRVISGASAVRIFDASSVQFAGVIDRVTRAGAVILHAPTPNHPVFLTGRRSVLGNLLHIASHGFDYTERAADVSRIYEGAGDTHTLLRRYNIDFIVVGPDERETFRTNDELFAALPVAGSAAGYRLYRSDDRARETDCRVPCPSEVVSARAVEVHQ